MSGGVDSAVALLRAGPRAVGVTLRLWIDPEGSDVERACCSRGRDRRTRNLPQARDPTRHDRRARGVPTGDRRAVRARLPAGRDAESLHPLQRLLPLRTAPPLRAPCGSRAPGDGALRAIVEHDGRLLLARAADSEKDQSYMLARLDPRVLDRISFPLGGQSKEETRAEAERAGLAAARRAESQEACFLGGDDYRAFLSRHGLKAEEGLSRTSADRSSVPTTASGASHRGSARARGGGRVAGLRAPPFRAAMPSSWVRANPWPEGGFGRTVASSQTRGASTSSSATGRRRFRAGWRRGRAGFDAVLDAPAYGVAPGQAAVLYDGDVVVGAGRIVSSRA